MSPSVISTVRLTIRIAVVLPHAGGPDQDADLAGGDLQREVVDRGIVLARIALGDVPVRNRDCWAATPPLRRSYSRYRSLAGAGSWLSSGGRGRCAALFMATATAMKTYQANAQDRERGWQIVDAEGKTLGRLATQIANVLRGKHKPTYTPHVDVGDFVIVVNAEKVAVTGDKREDKLYWRHSGYPGGIRSRTLGDLLEKRPEEVIRRGGQGDAPPQPARPPAASQAQGLRRDRSTPTRHRSRRQLEIET